MTDSVRIRLAGCGVYTPLGNGYQIVSTVAGWPQALFFMGRRFRFVDRVFRFGCLGGFCLALGGQFHIDGGIVFAFLTRRSWEDSIRSDWTAAAFRCAPVGSLRLR